MLSKYKETLYNLERDIKDAHRTASSALYIHKRSANIKLANAYKAMADFRMKLIVASDVAYLANHINQLEESDFVTPFEYSLDNDEDILQLCSEYGL